jgi:hypothetical protein
VRNAAAVAVRRHVADAVGGDRRHERDGPRHVGGNHQKVGRLELRRIEHLVFAAVPARATPRPSCAVTGALCTLRWLRAQGTTGSIRNRHLIARLPVRVRRLGHIARCPSCMRQGQRGASVTRAAHRGGGGGGGGGAFASICGQTREHVALRTHAPRTARRTPHTDQAQIALVPGSCSA